MRNSKKEVNVYERLWKLWAMICKMIMDGVRDPKKVGDLLQTVIAGACEVYFCQLYKDVVLGATDGTTTFLNEEFVIANIHPDFNSLVDKPTSPMVVEVQEIIVDGRLEEIFGSLGENRPKFKGESQIVEFCVTHRGKLCSNGLGFTFFELEGGLGVCVSVLEGGSLGVQVGINSIYNCDFSALQKNRVVIPQR